MEVDELVVLSEGKQKAEWPWAMAGMVMVGMVTVGTHQSSPQPSNYVLLLSQLTRKQRAWITCPKSAVKGGAVV